MYFMPEKKKSAKKGSINFAAVIAGVLILLSGFLFQIFDFQVLGKDFLVEKAVMFNIVQDLGSFELPGNLNTIVFLMVFTYFIILLLYFLAGFSVLSYKSASVASFLTIIYLVLGVYFVSSFNNHVSLPFFGNSLGSAKLGLGTYLVPLFAAAYLLLKDVINKHLV